MSLKWKNKVRFIRYLTKQKQRVSLQDARPRKKAKVTRSRSKENLKEKKREMEERKSLKKMLSKNE